MNQTHQRQLFGLFAELLGYPSHRLAAAAGEAAALAGPISSTAAAHLLRFQTFAAQTPLARVEEIYTSVFELDAACHPYVGYHLFGESYKRSAFLLGLKERYRPHGLAYGVELPDHLSVVLAYLAVNRDPCEAEVLIGEALQPALQKMLASKEEEPPDPAIPTPPPKGGPYRAVLEALDLVLQEIAPPVEMIEAIPAFDLTPATA
ncbi:MAG TPA: nitrate reductase molybdenum cofactor assembly chaperone [Anaerolineae bacterium]|nr:nitrate reductase molybdenum cofactor assembly chaperone [Anaerolineae bacterium]HNU05237.1 nitrate reductase molybdenum cofactor assembly chaperone [Anaerolineae bacterium]